MNDHLTEIHQNCLNSMHNLFSVIGSLASLIDHAWENRDDLIKEQQLDLGDERKDFENSSKNAMRVIINFRKIMHAIHHIAHDSAILIDEKNNFTDLKKEVENIDSFCFDYISKYEHFLEEIEKKDLN